MGILGETSILASILEKPNQEFAGKFQGDFSKDFFMSSSKKSLLYFFVDFSKSSIRNSFGKFPPQIPLKIFLKMPTEFSLGI